MTGYDPSEALRSAKPETDPLAPEDARAMRDRIVASDPGEVPARAPRAAAGRTLMVAGGLAIAAAAIIALVAAPRTQLPVPARPTAALAAARAAIAKSAELAKSGAIDTTLVAALPDLGGEIQSVRTGTVTWNSEAIEVVRSWRSEPVTIDSLEGSIPSPYRHPVDGVLAVDRSGRRQTGTAVLRDFGDTSYFLRSPVTVWFEKANSTQTAGAGDTVRDALGREVSPERLDHLVRALHGLESTVTADGATVYRGSATALELLGPYRGASQMPYWTGPFSTVAAYEITPAYTEELRRIETTVTITVGSNGIVRSWTCSYNVPLFKGSKGTDYRYEAMYRDLGRAVNITRPSHVTTTVPDYPDPSPDPEGVTPPPTD